MLCIEYVSAAGAAVGAAGLWGGTCVRPALVHHAEDLLCGRAVNGVGVCTLVKITDVDAVDQTKGFRRTGRSSEGHGRARLVGVRAETVDERVDVGNAKYPHGDACRRTVRDACEIVAVAVGGNVKRDTAKDAGAENAVVRILGIKIGVQIAVFGEVGDEGVAASGVC